MNNFRLTLYSGSGENDDDDESYINRYYWSKCISKYDYMDQIESAMDVLPAHCVERYMFDVAISDYEGALNKYKTLLDNGYDKKFEVYAKYSRVRHPLWNVCSFN